MEIGLDCNGVKIWHQSLQNVQMDIRQRQDIIVRSLRRRGLTSVDDLATEAGASRRTVLRDISALRDQGYVIHSEPGRGGGLQLDPQSVQTTTRLSVTEVFALLISVAAMRAAGSLPFSALADSGLAKIETSLPADKLRDLRRSALRGLGPYRGQRVGRHVRQIAERLPVSQPCIARGWRLGEVREIARIEVRHPQQPVAFGAQICPWV